MKENLLKVRKSSMGWKIEKHYRWFRRKYYRHYSKTVRLVEQELGGILVPC